jgi:hypothetical protein
MFWNEVKIISTDAASDAIGDMLLEFGAKGVGELTANVKIDDPLTMNLFKHIEKNNMPTTIHISEKIGGGYGLVDQLGLPGLNKVLEIKAHRA